MSNTVINPVLLPLIRQVMPNAIANSIIGVQPMTGPSAQVFAMRWRYKINVGDDRGRQKVNPAIYNHFLRLNNRRRTQGDADFQLAGYFSARGNGTIWLGIDPEHAAWCDQQFGKHGWWGHRITGNLWFVREQDRILYTLTWGQ
jgi:hypothetical protein